MLAEQDMVRQGLIQVGDLAHLRPALRRDNSVALEMWNVMGGIDWQALPILVEMRDIPDVEGLLDRLLVIRSVIDRQHENKPRF